MQIPVLRTSKVLHIGTLDLATKGRNSLEGHCLSVSRCPEAWRSIAQLGGNPLWHLELPDAAFLDLHQVEESRQLRVHVEAWGFAQGYVTLAHSWRAWYCDEAEVFRYSLHASEAAARAEIDEDAEGPDGKPAVEMVTILAGTPRLAEHVRVSDLATRDCFDLLALVWAEATQPALAGIWWSETYDPESLSAPRGGIFPSRLSQFKAAPSSFGDHDDDEESTGLKPGRLPLHL